MAKFSQRAKGKNSLIVVVGPTASGKSDLGVQLAKKFNGEIISADSRQVYKGLDIGSGKITKKEMMGVPHHLLDVALPRRTFTVSQYQKLAAKAIDSIHKRGKLPLLVGGSPFYVYAFIDGLAIPEVKPNAKFRKELEKLSVDKLYKKLQKLDPQRARTIESKNPRRLIRALEIIHSSGKPVPKLEYHSPYDTLMIGIKKSPEELKILIAKRLEKRLKQGMIAEVKKLHDPPAGRGVSWKRLEEFGLEYTYIAQYLQNKISKQEMANSIQKQSERFARRQMTWFKKDPRIHWIQSQKDAELYLHTFTQ
ncbi:tRNA (adenosine(37)-N6)-dimethylallyltransferase MiaA [Patescibacteria group bacterium]|nr:tRNA (adenosine(37)-N6)-dimethylallyltransferase MiaA [Patescibacteria group bacterium]